MCRLCIGLSNESVSWLDGVSGTGRLGKCAGVFREEHGTILDYLARALGEANSR